MQVNGLMTHELTTVPSSTLEDIDLLKFKKWLEAHIPRLAAQKGSLEDAMLKLRLVAPMGSKMVPTLAAIYTFGEEPQWLQPQLALSAAIFEGSEIADDVSLRDHFSGSIEALLEHGMGFVEAHARPVIDQVRPESPDVEFPLVAVREALANALIHRDLKAPGHIQLRIFPERLEIWSPGAPVAPPEAGVSLPRNPVVAGIARQMGMVEQLGRGLMLMRRVAGAGDGLIVRSGRDGVLVVIKSVLAQAQPLPVGAN